MRTKEEIQELALLVRIHEANCAIPFPTSIELAFRIAIMKKIGLRTDLKELRALAITPQKTRTGTSPNSSTHPHRTE